MNSYGHVITASQIETALRFMRSGNMFAAGELERHLRNSGVPDGAVPSRVADRLLQSERRAGNIIFRKGKWTATAQGIAARSGETGTGSTEGKSPVRKDAPGSRGLTMTQGVAGISEEMVEKATLAIVNTVRVKHGLRPLSELLDLTEPDAVLYRSQARAVLTTLLPAEEDQVTEEQVLAALNGAERELGGKPDATTLAELDAGGRGIVSALSKHLNIVRSAIPVRSIEGGGADPAAAPEVDEVLNYLDRRTADEWETRAATVIRLMRQEHRRLQEQVTLANLRLLEFVEPSTPAGVDEEVGEVQPMATAPKDGTPILVFFDRPGLGWMRVTWEDPHGDGSYSIWCVDDNKNGPYPLRGYNDGDDKGWLPLPAALQRTTPEARDGQG